MSQTAPLIPGLNPRVEAVQPSATLAISSRAAALRREGRDVIALSAGEPDFITPEPIMEAAHQALRDGHTHYTPNAGLFALREAIAEKFRKQNGVDVTAGDVLCTNGAKQAVAQAVIAVCREGDEVLIPAPYWVSYPEMARLAGAEPVILSTSAAEGYKVSPEALDAALTSRTRVFLFNSPSNPTGAVYTPEEIKALVEVLRTYPEVLVISDEIYEYVIYGVEHRSVASFPGVADRTVTVNGFSKGFAMTGWRLGYLAGPRWLVDAVAKIQSQITSGPNSITQHAALAAFTMDFSMIEEMVRAFRERRDVMLSRIREIEVFQCPPPEGAFYLFPDAAALYGRKTPAGEPIEDSGSLCTYLLESAEVALVPGAAFGDDRGIRISYAASQEQLDVAMDRIETALEVLS